MHPVVIMSYDKSPAITKAVAALEEAGLEVIVLNTATAKLAQFLGALAGEDEETDPEAALAPSEDDEPKEPAPEDNTEVEPEEELATEALVNDEKVLVEFVDGKDITLCLDKLGDQRRAGSKVTYRLGESEFSFWSNKLEGEALKTLVELKLYGREHYAKVILTDGEKPLLQIGRDWLRETRYPHK